MSLFRSLHASLFPVLLALATVACGDAGKSAPNEQAMNAAETTDASTEATYALDVSCALTTDAQGAAFTSQNGATVHIRAEDLRDKQVIWIVTEAGETPPNAKFLGVGMTLIGADLSFSFRTPASFADGAYELTVFALVEGTDFTKGPRMGDIAAYTPLDTKVPDGEPPVTGVTVRVRVHGGDAHVELDNASFVRF